jgi:hypothetical protein
VTENGPETSGATGGRRPSRKWTAWIRPSRLTSPVRTAVVSIAVIAAAEIVAMILLEVL